MLELFIWGWLLLVTLAFIVWFCTPAAKPQVSSPLYDAENFYDPGKKSWPALDGLKGCPYISLVGGDGPPQPETSR
jgi:hypothetical protein